MMMIWSAFWMVASRWAMTSAVLPRLMLRKLRCTAISRWRQLRSGGLTAEAVIARAREMHEEIAGARTRDSLRWPQCGMGEGNAMNIRDIEDFVETMFVRMDEYIEELASGA